MRLRSTRQQRHRPRHEHADDRPREGGLRLDLSSIRFTDEEILADLHYPERPPARAAGPR